MAKVACIFWMGLSVVTEILMHRNSSWLPGTVSYVALKWRQVQRFMSSVVKLSLRRATSIGTWCLPARSGSLRPGKTGLVSVLRCLPGKATMLPIPVGVEDAWSAFFRYIFWLNSEVSVPFFLKLSG